ncbi:MAG: hypothetical protein PUG55_05895, partial [Bacillales bacterium]|nr:hypothetical protein [Bacillales bacterium]
MGHWPTCVTRKNPPTNFLEKCSVYIEQKIKILGDFMKIMRMVCGIICCCLFLVIVFQSCAAGIGNALADSGEVSGSAGFITAVLMLVAGIISIAGRKSKG